MQWIVDIVRFMLAGYLQGKILLWSGSVVSIPSGWALCNGTQGTPDLRDKFIVGAGSTYAPGAKAGVNSHDHDFTASGMWHSYPIGTVILPGYEYGNKTGTHLLEGTTDSEPLPQPYYSLAFIMKL